MNDPVEAQLVAYIARSWRSGMRELPGGTHM